MIYGARGFHVRHAKPQRRRPPIALRYPRRYASTHADDTYLRIRLFINSPRGLHRRFPAFNLIESAFNIGTSPDELRAAASDAHIITIATRGYANTTTISQYYENYREPIIMKYDEIAIN